MSPARHGSAFGLSQAACKANAMNFWSCLILLFVGTTPSFAQEPSRSQNADARQAESKGSEAKSSAPAATENQTPLPDLTVPTGADRAALEKIVAAAKAMKPNTLAAYRHMQTGLRDASNGLLKAIADKNDPVRMQAELDVLSSSAALMVNDTEEAREKILQRIQSYYEGRKELSLADVQTGMIVAFYLEMQPRKSPARDVYKLLYDRLENDPREEMQSLRINLLANVRRLEMLGNKLELNVTSIDGKPIKTEDFAGKFLIVDFFATWCQPCLAEVPRLKKHCEKYRRSGLEIIAINLDDERSTLDKYLTSQSLPWPVVYDAASDPSDKLQVKYGISSLPTVLLLNKEGVVVSLEARGPELDRLMERIFEAPTPADPPAPKSDVKADAKADAPSEGKAVGQGESKSDKGR